MLTGRKLLLADDSLTIQKVVSLTFDDEAMEVTTVGSGAEALRYLGESLPDIVLADVFMPEPNGYQLCERIKTDERTRHIPVLLLVGTFEPFNQAEARRVGADEVLTKPFQSIRDLVNKVGGLLGGHADEKNSDAAHSRNEHGEDEATRDLSPFAADARAAEPTGASAAPSNTTPADAFQDFDMDDATIQTTPAEAFDAGRVAPAFSEIKEEEQFTDRIETDEAFILSDDDSPAHAYAVSAAAAGGGSSASSSASSSEGAPAPGSAFAAHAARAAEADDALLDIGDIAPARVATDEADDFILDIGDDDAFDSPTVLDSPSAFAPASAEADEVDMLFAEQAQTTEVPKVFAQPDILATTPEPDAPPVASFVPEPQEEEELEAPEMTEAPSLLFATETEPEAQDFMQAAAQREGDVSADAPLWDTEPVAASIVAHAGGVALTGAPGESELLSEDRAVAVEDEPVAVRESSTVATATTAAATSEQSQGAQTQAASPSSLSPEMLDEVVRRVVAHMSEQVVREIAWEVVPDLAERLIKQRLEEESTRRP